MQLVGSIGDVVMLAVGLEPMAKWQCAPPPFASRSMVTPAPTAVDCTLLVVTVIIWVVPSIPKVVNCPLSSRNSLLIVALLLKFQNLVAVPSGAVPLTMAPPA